MTGRPPPFDRRAVAAWCVYDWANSAFPTVITTFVFATYFAQAVATDPIAGAAQLGHALTIAGLIVAIVSPLAGSIADLTGRRKLWLATFSLVTVLATAALWYARPSPDAALLALVLMGVATIGFEMATVFYNAMLPELAPRDYIGRISGWGWGLGYVGGIVCLGIALTVFIQAETPPFGLDKAQAEHVRATAVLAALWFAVFSAPIFLFVHERKVAAIGTVEAVRRGLGELRATLATLAQSGQRHILWFLAAQMIYADGLGTLFAFGGVYAAGAFGMDLSEVIMFGIALNVTAGAGAFAFAWIDDWIGARRTIAAALTAIIAITIGLLFVETKAWFWALGMMLGAFFGPVQSASRSLIARLAPETHRTQMFGLFALSGRITTFLGPAALGWATAASGSQRIGMATIVPFFVVGLVLLLTKVPANAGNAASR